MTPRPPVPPFTLETATQKVRLGEDSWNSHQPEKVSQGYALDSRWRGQIVDSEQPKLGPFNSKKPLQSMLDQTVHDLIYIAVDEAALNELEKLGYLTTPVTVIDGQVVVDFDRDKLQRLLEAP